MADDREVKVRVHLTLTTDADPEVPFVQTIALDDENVPLQVRATLTGARKGSLKALMTAIEAVCPAAYAGRYQGTVTGVVTNVLVDLVEP